MASRFGVRGVHGGAQTNNFKSRTRFTAVGSETSAWRLELLARRLRRTRPVGVVTAFGGGCGVGVMPRDAERRVRAMLSCGAQWTEKAAAAALRGLVVAVLRGLVVAVKDSSSLWLAANACDGLST